MTLFKYLDERYRTLSLELQTEYTIPKEAELKAAYALIQYQRSFFKFLKMPVLCLRYVFMNLGWMKPPRALEPVKAPLEPEGVLPSDPIQ